MNLSSLTYAEYRAARVLATLEVAYPQVRPADGKLPPSAFVRAYEARGKFNRPRGRQDVRA